MTTTRTLTIGRIRRIGDIYGYTASVYRPARYEQGEGWGDDYTGECRAAHGGVTYTEEEDHGGRQRQVLSNAGHYEVGPWGPTRAYREAVEREEARRRQSSLESHEDHAAGCAGFRVVAATGDHATIQTPQGRKVLRVTDLEQAAADPSHPRMTRESALAAESDEDRRVRWIYRSLLRHAQQMATA